MLNKITILFLLIFLSCRDDKEETLASCNGLLGQCANNANVAYCTFGYKFGDSNPFQPSGQEVAGPAKSAVITYRFQDAGRVFNTHSQDGITSLAVGDNYKVAVRGALRQWQDVANITFIEKGSNEVSNVTVMVANIEQGGLGYPAFDNAPCNELAGLLIIGTRSTVLEGLCLHELGHVLGLGHVSSANVMNPDRPGDFNQLQAGDVAGVQSIYGKR